MNTQGFRGLLRRLVQSRFSSRLIPRYCRHYAINLEEIERPLADYESLNAFFTRKLKVGARPLADAEILSPVDARVKIVRKISAAATFEVKGQDLSLAELLGAADEAAAYIGGLIVVLYLSPADYHRIHAPFSAEGIRVQSLGAFSWPVNEKGLTLGNQPLCRNFRKVYRNTDKPAAMIAVGATNVNSITDLGLTSWEKGAEIARFEFGSTVILTFKADRFEPVESLKAVLAENDLAAKTKTAMPQGQDGFRIKQGEALGHWL